MSKTQEGWAFAKDQNGAPIEAYAPIADPIMLVAGDTSTAEQELEEGLYMINATGAVCIKIGETGMGAAAVTDFSVFAYLIPTLIRIIKPFNFIRVIRGATDCTLSIVKMGG